MAASGFVVCADITGYTSYLSKSELEHASGILGDLLSLLLGETRAPLHLSRVEGDAVVSYSEAIQGSDPQVLVDRLEATYVAFRRALAQMVVNTACTCNACANIPALDLKFVVHHGPFVVKKLGVQNELMGAEVNHMFRLVKNHVREKLGFPGYIAFTDAALAALDLPGYAARLVDHVEEDPERGSVTLHVRDMGPVWEARRRDGPVDIGEAQVDMFTDLAAPLERVWTVITRPETRRLVMGADRMEHRFLEDGRVGRDAVYLCFHGEARLEHTVVDWDPPFRYVFASAFAGGLQILAEFRLEALGEAGTRFHYRTSFPTGDHADTPQVREMVKGRVVQGAEGTFRTMPGLLAATPME